MKVQEHERPRGVHPIHLPSLRLIRTASAALREFSLGALCSGFCHPAVAECLAGIVGQLADYSLLEKIPQESRLRARILEIAARDDRNLIDSERWPTFNAVKICPNCWILDTPGGAIQIHQPPDSQKVHLRDEREFPQIQVLPSGRFWVNDQNLADLEFIIYGNRFLKGRRTFVVGDRRQLSRIRRILSETIWGPSFEDYLIALKRTGLPGDRASKVTLSSPWPRDGYYCERDARAMAESFRRESAIFALRDEKGDVAGLDDFVGEILFNAKGVAAIGDLEIERISDAYIEVRHRGQVIDRVNALPLDTPEPPLLLTPRRRPAQWPLFQVIPLGAGSGFTPNELTAGFVFQWNGQGLLVDPPAFAPRQLQQIGILPNEVSAILLTHLHGDHDDGALQMIFKGQRIRLITSRVIYESFLRKAGAILDDDTKTVAQYVDFEEIVPGRPHHYMGALLEVAQSLHPIPALQFRLTFRGRTIGFSGDTFYSPAKVREWAQQGTLSSARVEDVLEFIWDADLIFQEMGHPPIHTPWEALSALPEMIKQKMYLYHTAGLPEGAQKFAPGLQFVRAGEPLVLLGAERNRDHTPERLLKATEAPLFRDFRGNCLLQLLLGTTIERFEPGEVIVREGAPGDAMYVIVDGMARLEVEEGRLPGDPEILGYYYPGEQFGELSLVEVHGRRIATIRAEGDYPCFVMKITRKLFEAYFPEVTKQRIRKAGELIRDIGAIPFLKRIPISMVVDLAAEFERQVLTRGMTLIQQGKPGSSFYVLVEGKVRVERSERGGRRLVNSLVKNDFFGEISQLFGSSATCTVTVESDVAKLLVLSKDAFRRLIKEYPDINHFLQEEARMRLRH